MYCAVDHATNMQIVMPSPNSSVVYLERKETRALYQKWHWIQVRGVRNVTIRSTIKTLACEHSSVVMLQLN